MATVSPEGEEDLLPLIQSYLGASLFRHAQHYELITHSHAQYLDFAYDKVAVHPPQPPPSLTPLDALLPPTPSPTPLRLIRLLQYNHVLLCLAAKQSQQPSDDKFTIIAIVFEHKDAAQLWRSNHSFLTKIRIAHPHSSLFRLSPHSSAALLVTRLENISVDARLDLSSCDPEKVRTAANAKFREKNYLQALAEYEFGLGLMQCPDRTRERAILYANSSQCLFELRLYQSALAYAEAAVTIDRKYVKGLYRRFACLLQLKQLKLAPSALMAISQASAPEFQRAQATFYRHHLHHHGLFDWKQIFAGPALNFGDYLSAKVVREMDQSGKSYYEAANPVRPFELILLSKPLIYQRSEHQKFGQDYSSLIAQIRLYSTYEFLFRDTFASLPHQLEFEGHVLKFTRNNPESMEVNEVHAKCLRCLEREKSVTVPAKEMEEWIGIWPELYGFKHNCLANCTYLHLKGGVAVFALRPIEEGEALTLDFLNYETQRRQVLMREKLGRSCSCTFCEWEWDYDFEATGELLYEFYRQEHPKWLAGGLQKISLFFLWELAYVKQFNEIELIKEYLLVLEKYPLWECVLNCLKYLRTRRKNDNFDLIKGTLKKIFEKFFKMTHAQAVDLLKTIL